MIDYEGAEQGKQLKICTIESRNSFSQQRLRTIHDPGERRC